MQNKKKSGNILIFGCDFFPIKKTSEINFWNDIVDKISAHYEEVVILSVNNRLLVREKLAANVFLYNVKPKYFGNNGKWSDPEYSGAKFHKMPMSVIYKTVSFISYLSVFDKIIRQHNIRNIHYMRIFGLLNFWLTRKYSDIFFSITVPTHVDRGFPLHNFYHKIKNLSLNAMDGIICTTEATRIRLEKLSINKEKLSVIHWTALQEKIKFSEKKLKILRNLYDKTDDKKIILWAGPLQDTGEKEFLFSLSIAKIILGVTDKFIFIFAFKPNKLKLEYKELAGNIKQLSIRETNRDQFTELKSITDLFLSPICNENRTVAPPITWIEMMALGIPVVTTNIDGVNEIIEHGENGLISKNDDTLVDDIIHLKEDDFAKFKINCVEKITRSFNIETISKKYISYWENSAK